MSPRKYRMGKRAASVARTRARIVEAAMALYQEQPVSQTSMQDVARRADVAPGTVSNHFADPDALSRAVVSELVRTLEAPTSALFAGQSDAAGRLRSLSVSLSRFYERAQPWFHVHDRERESVPAFAEGARRFNEHVDALIAEALAVEAGDDRVGVARALMSPPVYRDLRERGGKTAEAAGELVSEILLAWLEAT